MNKAKTARCVRFMGAVGLISIASVNPIYGQTPNFEPSSKDASKTFECTDVTIDFSETGSLTPEEKLALMDQALYKSLSQFDACQKSRMASGGGASGSGSAGGSNGSVASTEMSGTEEATNENNTGITEAVDQSVTPAEGDTLASSENEAGGAGQQIAENGKIPEDIPPANNDTVLEAQIRQAALNEPDPKIKSKLWDEYRKYKGLPPQN